MKRYSFRIGAPLAERLERHLFPGDHDEHGAVITAGIAETGDGVRFLAREVILAKDGFDYVPGKHGYRALTANFVARVSDHCARERLCYFAVHCHGGKDAVSFSPTDIESHRRGYPALLDITSGGPVGALVFAQNSVAGEIWTPDGVFPLTDLIIVGSSLRRLYPEPPPAPRGCEEIYHRQSLLFGLVGQRHLAGAKVGIIGLGGVGSLVNEWLARVGVGEIVAIDYDKMEPSNRSRVVGSRLWDSQDSLRASRWPLLRRLGERLSTRKVHVAERVAREASPRMKFHAVCGDVTDLAKARLLRDADFLFLCADTMQSRLVFNALVHQYVIPGVQIGSKIPIDSKTGEVGDAFSAARMVLPQFGGGCLLCNQLIPAERLRLEGLSEKERKQQAYVDDPAVSAPSVITMNALGAAQAANDFLFCFLGLADAKRAKAGYLMHYARERAWTSVDCSSDAKCLHCGDQLRSGFARGDRAALPCKEAKA